MRVLIADDHALIRAGLRALLLSTRGVHAVLEASDGNEALRIVARDKPEVALLDIGMPGMNGLEAISHIRESSSQTRVIILSMHGSEEYVRRALHDGASGYLVKKAGLAELQKALLVVTRGHTYVSPLVEPSIAGKHPDTDPGSFGRLSPRHREVLKLISQGLRTHEIANTLGIHVKTVETHRLEVMNRLGIRSIAGLVRYSIRNGLVPVESAAAPMLGAAEDRD